MGQDQILYDDKSTTSLNGRKDYMHHTSIKSSSTSVNHLSKSINTDKDDTNDEQQHDDYGIDGEQQSKQVKEITLTDIIGDFGWYQLSLMIITFIRYVCVAMMTNTGPLIAPDIDYYCQLPDILANATKDDLTIKSQLKNTCQIRLPTEILNHLDIHNLPVNIQITDDGMYNCSHWTYNTSITGKTMTDEFNLVCDRDWLRSLFQSSVSIGVVLASVFWGTFSDKHGRCYSMRICFIVSLISGAISIVAPNFMIYVLARSVCSLGDLGLVVSLATTLVESVGNKYRGAACIIVYLGWAMGVMIMPWITNYFKNFRTLMLFTVVCHIITLPWLLLKKESVRWLLISRQFSEAQREVKRIAKWNGCRSKLSQQNVDRKFAQLKARFDFDDDDDNDNENDNDNDNEVDQFKEISLLDNTSHDQNSSVAILKSDSMILRMESNINEVTPSTPVGSESGATERKQGETTSCCTKTKVKPQTTIENDDSYCNLDRSHNSSGSDDDTLFAGFDKLRQLFESKDLSTTTITLVWVTFNSELLYMSFILINSDVGDDLYLNYAMGGLMEILATLISCIMISNVTRRLSLTSTLLCISLLCVILAFIYQDASLVVWLLAAAKLAISTLSSLIYVTATEMFPTDLRQTGSGACATFGSMGAVVAPFICSQLVKLIGMQYVLILFGISSTTAALLVPFFLRETKGVELADTLEEIDSVGKRLKMMIYHNH